MNNALNWKITILLASIVELKILFLESNLKLKIQKFCGRNISPNGFEIPYFPMENIPITWKIFQTWRNRYYVNSRSYFQQWNLNWDTTFSNSSLDSKLGFLSVGLVLHFQVFPNSQRDWKFLNVALADFFSRWKIGILKSPRLHIFSKYEDTLSGTVYV